MVTLREAAQQALEALEKYDRTGNPVFWDQAEKVLRQALEAEQQDEPVAWMYDTSWEDGIDLKDWVTTSVPKDVTLESEGVRNIRPLYTRPQPAQQPVIPTSETCKCCGEGQADLAVLRICDKCSSEYAGQAEFDLAMRLQAEQQDEPVITEKWSNDDYAATRRAIVRAAAEIERSMK
jgi:hypothetical protein